MDKLAAKIKGSPVPMRGGAGAATAKAEPSAQPRIPPSLRQGRSNSLLELPGFEHLKNILPKSKPKSAAEQAEAERARRVSELEHEAAAAVAELTEERASAKTHAVSAAEAERDARMHDEHLVSIAEKLSRQANRALATAAMEEERSRRLSSEGVELTGRQENRALASAAMEAERERRLWGETAAEKLQTFAEKIERQTSRALAAALAEAERERRLSVEQKDTETAALQRRHSKASAAALAETERSRRVGRGSLNPLTLAKAKLDAHGASSSTLSAEAAKAAATSPAAVAAAAAAAARAAPPRVAAPPGARPNGRGRAAAGDEDEDEEGAEEGGAKAILNGFVLLALIGVVIGILPALAPLVVTPWPRAPLRPPPHAPLRCEWAWPAGCRPHDSATTRCALQLLPWPQGGPCVALPIAT